MRGCISIIIILNSAHTCKHRRQFSVSLHVSFAFLNVSFICLTDLFLSFFFPLAVHTLA